MDSIGNPVESAMVQAGVNQNNFYLTNAEGAYIITIPTDTLVTVFFNHPSFSPRAFEVQLYKDEIKNLDVKLFKQIYQLKEVKVVDNKETEVRQQAGSVFVKGEDLREIPVGYGEFTQQLVASGALGIASNNELSSDYSVRGGSFDENLIYVNNIEIYRPFIARSGQQEGLSFVNSNMVDNIDFSSGGWEAQYGDKLSSSLNIEYKKPLSFEGTLEASLLNGSLTLGGASKNKKHTAIIGARYKSTEYLLNTLQTDGEYRPKFGDVQSYLSFDLSGKGKKGKTYLDAIMSYAANRYSVFPSTRSTNFQTGEGISNLTIAFEGKEQLDYDTFQGGLKLIHNFNDKFTSNLITSAMVTQERERSNLESAYRICDVDDIGNGVNDCATEQGIGGEYQYSRNTLKANVYTVENRNSWLLNDLFDVEFGVQAKFEEINDNLSEYQFQDSADYVISIDDQLKTENNLESQRYSAYAQSSYYSNNNQHKMTLGVRGTYWSVNNEVNVSPRFQYSFKPEWEKDVVFNFASGVYYQPPFYREMRRPDGTLNEDLRAQGSLHIIGGINYNFEQWGRPFKLISEVYYKHLWNVVPYNIDNIRIRYSGENEGVAYATGIDTRLSGEFIPGTQSWISLSVMSTKEKIDNDPRGYIRRPTDQRVTLAMFFQDHLPNNPTMRMNLRFMYGSGLPFGPPDNPELRNAFSGGNDYMRLDLGLNKLIALNKKSDNPNEEFMKNLSIGVEILNVLGNNNVISYTWVKTYDGTQYAVPNTLSQRFFNVKMILHL
ncbi:TonB-dependent receptor plug domain-containing protein [Flammeovirga agarivorans]|uniref:TonB-dependent receptor plug domain-containing protein n=1 Tax=Flammeovirga agarivorans TaxID=2726742 RepID=A0A7X8SLH1_9BACT|nr:TonB-dependent receptor plug domain-containing protein [Flammeovirga agarivorans]NLR92430.1 TonB-dependent receptor plug domain-containing protein [Flammeovirga agarivorans]